ncbi:MAG: HAD-IIB family hydrolase [Balneolaceae bacterium]|nr:HAD-IIB family hydrolase [Balneolaceae bacterium]
MIKLFISDLDGCLAHPFKTPDWQAITRIRELNQLSKENENKLIPPLTICSGRPFPYVEALAQWLDVDLPVLFESGGGMYDSKTNVISWNPQFSEEAKMAITEIKHWLNDTIIKNYKGTIPEFTKHTDAGLVNPDPTKIALMHKEINNYIDQHYNMFEVHQTDVSVNIILKRANKGEGVKFLCEVLGFELSEVAYIGDSSGDIPALRIVGKSYAPVNAKSYTKDEVQMITAEATKGVLQAYEDIVEHNRRA